MNDFWDNRYSHEKYAYGKTPNVFLKETLERLDLTGRALFPAEGEGRNAVFAAQYGLETFAFDTSIEGRRKALLLAEENGVSIHYETGTLEETSFSTQSFDVIVLIFAHFPPPVLLEYHRHFVEMLNPGGFIILEGFSKNNLKYLEDNPYIGGPKDKAMLFTTERIEASFTRLETIQLEEKVVELNEGKFHQGTGSVVRYIGRK